MEHVIENINLLD